MTTFDDWLRQLRAAGKLAPNGITIDRGLPFLWTFTLTGDWSGATIASSLRLSPDADGSTVEDFTTANLGYADDVTTFELSLTAVETAALTADTDGDALVTLAWDVVFTPSGGDPMRLFGGPAYIAGKVTNG